MNSAQIFLGMTAAMLLVGSCICDLNLEYHAAPAIPTRVYDSELSVIIYGCGLEKVMRETLQAGDLMYQLIVEAN